MAVPVLPLTDQSQNRGQEGQCQAGQGKDVSGPRVKRQAAGRRDRSGEDGRRHQAGAAEHAAEGVDDPADAGRGGPEEISAVFDGPEDRLGPMLIRSRGGAVPAIVGDRHKKGGAPADEAPDEPGKDDLVADGRSELVPRVRMQDGLGPGRDLADGVGQLFDEEKDLFVGRVLPKGDQMHLEVEAPGEVRVKGHGRIVVEPVSGRTRRFVGPDEERDPARPDVVFEPGAKLTVDLLTAAETERDREFRPDDQARAARSGLTGQGHVLVEDLPDLSRLGEIPIDIRGNIPLDDRRLDFRRPVEAGLLELVPAPGVGEDEKPDGRKERSPLFPRHGQDERALEKDEDKRDPAHPGQGSGLEEGQVFELARAQEPPGKSRQEMGREIFASDPEEWGQDERPGRERPAGPDEEGAEESPIKGQECDEGQVWEAAMFAPNYKLDNLTAIVDYNGLQLDGTTKDIMNLEPFANKWRSFNWEVMEIDGHDIAQIIDALNKAKKVTAHPVVIVAHTVKGKGVSFMENNVDFHGKAPNKAETELALKELA